MLQEAGHIKYTVVFIFQYIQCLYLINAELARILVSLGTKVQSQIILDPDYLPDYISVSYDYIHWISYIHWSSGMPNRSKLHKYYQHPLQFHVQLISSKYVATVQTNWIAFFQQCFEICVFFKYKSVHIYRNHMSTWR